MPRVEGDLVYALARHQAASSDKDYARIFATNFDAGRLAFENHSFVEAYAFLSEANKAAHVGLLPTSAEFKELLGQTCAFTYRVDEALEHFQRGCLWRPMDTMQHDFIRAAAPSTCSRRITRRAGAPSMPACGCSGRQRRAAGHIASSQPPCCVSSVVFSTDSACARFGLVTSERANVTKCWSKP